MIQMTPLKVEILLHYYYSPLDCENVEFPAQQEAIGEFLRAGLLMEEPEGCGRRYCGNTEALNVYVEALMKVPLPHQAWVI
jgi:hypothetical protein